MLLKKLGNWICILTWKSTIIKSFYHCFSQDIETNDQCSSQDIGTNDQCSSQDIETND